MVVSAGEFLKMAIEWPNEQWTDFIDSIVKASVGLNHYYYVSKLYRGLKKNSTTPFEFICISDNKNIEADTILPYNHFSDIKKHWHKLKFFSPQFANQQPGDDIIIMDIDQIIVNNVDELLNWPVKENELLTYGQWWNSNLKINGGFYNYK